MHEPYTSATVQLADAYAGHIYSNMHDPSFTANLFKPRWTRWPRCRRPHARGLVLHTARGMRLVGINTTRGVQCSAK